jgi:pyruvate,water dikinase
MKGPSRNIRSWRKGKVIVKGNGIGDTIGAGRARILQSPDESDKLEEGDILVTEMTNPDWDPIMKKTSAIVTNSGGRTSHAAIVAREQGVVAVVGAKGATDAIEDGQEITVSSVDGSTGVVYEGMLDWDEEEVDLDKLGTPNTEVMLILSDPLSAFRYAQYPVKGVGLTRLEFAINNDIGIHPLALVHFDELEDEEVKEAIAKRTAPWESKEQFFVEKLAMAVGTIAAAFYPRDVIVRMSDFKSNEYANLLGGSQFEPEEENPMLGFRGASRYYSDEYREGFRLECQAMKRAIEDMGLDNIILMVPFCRTPEEGRRVRETMEEFGIGSSDHGGDGATQVYVMVEIPANVIGAEAFADVFDGFSIGSNDLTQLTIGVDRDSAKVSDIFDERNDQVKEMIAMAIDKARKKNRKIGLCGQAPSDFPEIARFLVEQKIESISFTPDAVASGIRNIVKAESE